MECDMTQKEEKLKGFTSIGRLRVPKRMLASNGISVPMTSVGLGWLGDIFGLAMVILLRLTAVVGLLLTLWIILGKSASAAEIDMAAISQIESSGGKRLIGDGGHSLGEYQLHRGVILDYNRRNKTSYTHKDALNPAVARKIASWYLNVEIPRLLKHFGLPVNNELYVIASFNYGIGNVKRWHENGADFNALPKVTQTYIKKYEKLTGVAL